MGLVLLVVTGSLLGWLATIALRIDSGREIGRNIVWGMAGAVLLGVIASNGLVLGGVDATTLLFGLLGSVLFVGIYNFIQRKRGLGQMRQN